MPPKADRMTTEAELVKHLAPLDPFCIYHFGSSTRSEGMRPDSDIDLAFLSDQPKGPFDVFSVAQNIARLCHRDVDLIDLRKCGTVMAMRVIETGRKLFVS